MMTTTMLCVIGGGSMIAAGAIRLFVQHQRHLKDRAFLMREAVRNGDFTFRLPTKNLLPGERAMQQTLNDMENDIGRLVAKHEVESWQRLVRVLTHEIMNATAPISSICQSYLNSPSIKGTPYEEGIKAISNTSKSLTTFIDNYRKLTQLQPPTLENIRLSALVNNIKALYPTLKWHTNIPSFITIKADESMMRQVFVNLTKNAIEANATDIDIRWNHGIRFSNNGMPVTADVAREMFTPFFTTKTSGTGIGLALSRQILMMQGFTLSLAETSVTSYHVTFNIDIPANS